MLLLMGFAACTGGNHTYVNHTDGQYSIADDTLIFQDTIIINRMGYQKIHDGIIQPKTYKVRQWGSHSPDAPVIRFEGKQAFWNNTIYRQLP